MDAPKKKYTLYDQLIKARLKTPGQLFVEYFLRGILVVLPIAITIGISSWILKSVGGYFHLQKLGVGTIILYALGIVTSIIFIGFITRGVIVQQLLGFFEGIIDRAPGLNFIFGTTKDMTEAFVGEKKKFTKPVVVEIELGVYKIGFLTQEKMDMLDLPDCCAVYLPYSYTFTGEIVIVQKSKVHSISIESGTVTKFVLSGGATNIK